MSEIQIFNNDEFGEVRTVVIDGEAWFVGVDIAKILGYADPHKALQQHIELEDRKTATYRASDKSAYPLWSGTDYSDKTLINESGLYSLIFGSKLDGAKRFKGWVTHEVLPSIRKTGGYQAPQSVPQQIQLLAQGYVDLEKKVDSVTENVETMKTDLQAMKDEMPMFPAELEQITRAARRKGIEVLGGGDSIAYHDRGLCSTVYRDIYREIHRNFGVNSYKLIRRSECGKVIGVIDGYRLPVVLAERVAKRNTEVAA